MSQYRVERVNDGPRPWAVVHYYEGTDEGALSDGIGIVADDFETEQDAQEIADSLHRASAWSDRVDAREDEGDGLMSRIAYLRGELEAGRIDLWELAEIEAAYAALDPATLSDRPENATAWDMLDELQARRG